MSSFTRACDLAELADHRPLAVDVDGVDVAIVRAADEVFAIHDECSHAAIPLSEGDVEDCEIECWLHGSRFDLRTGKPLGLPATEPVPVYPCRVADGGVFVDVHTPRNPDMET